MPRQQPRGAWPFAASPLTARTIHREQRGQRRRTAKERKQTSRASVATANPTSERLTASRSILGLSYTAGRREGQPCQQVSRECCEGERSSIDPSHLGNVAKDRGVRLPIEGVNFRHDFVSDDLSVIEAVDESKIRLADQRQDVVQA